QLPRCHSSNFPQTHLGDDMLEAVTLDVAGGRATKVLIDDFDVLPAQFPQPRFHGVLQLLALDVVQHLVARGLTNIEDSFTLQMVWPNLVSHRLAPFRGRCRRLAPVARVGDGPEAVLLSVAPPAAASTRWAVGEWAGTDPTGPLGDGTSCASASPLG